MKKIYISICALVISFSAIAQVASKAIQNIAHSENLSQIEFIQSNEVINSSNSILTPMANIIWESDFSNAADWIMVNNGSFTNEGWNIDAVMDSWYLPAFSSTSGGNFAEVGNGDPSTATNWPMQVEYTLTTANHINVYDSIGSGNATLSFEEFGARFNDLQSIQISTDGINFTTIGDNLNYPVTSQSAGSNPYPNPALREINLAPYLGATPYTVYIRFSWTTNYPGSASDPNVWVAYGWCIDDVKISESPSNRVTMEDAVTGGFWIDYANYTGTGLNSIYGLDYSVTPLSQVQNHPYAIEAIFRNEGTSPQNVNLTFDVTGTAISSGSSNSTLLNPGDSILLGASFSPTMIGTYSVDIWGVADSAGAGVTTSQTNMDTRSIEVSDYVYGKDLGLPTSSTWTVGGPADQWHFTTRFEMYAPEQLYSLRAYITDESIVGAEVKAILYEADTTASNGLILLDESDNYTITSQDLGSWVDIPFVSAIPLLNGYAYEIGIAGIQHPTDSVVIGCSGESMYNGEHSLFDEFGLNPNDPANFGTPTWYYITRTPMVRMNFDPASSVVQSFNCVNPVVGCTDPGDGSGQYASLSACQAACTFNGLQQFSSFISIFPNPTTGLFTVLLDDSEVYDMKINNLIGQNIYTETIFKSETMIDLSGFEKGIYIVELRNKNKTFTEKVIIK
jgi:hypothetical protein